jgi:exodeoxyribonuclease VII large subunit
MINVISRRFPMTKILLYPALVQGDNAYRSLISGVQYFNNEQAVDVIIIGRGGGSMEDLWAFNNVDLAYAIANSKIPTISAVGHESDFTICDFVADLRAPTPSAAAELAVPDTITVRNLLRSYISSAEKSIISDIQKYRNLLSLISSSRVLISKEDLLNEYRMKLDLASDKLDNGINNLLNNRKYEFDILTTKLNAISPLNTLKRGYTIALNEDGRAVSSVDNINTNQKLYISFADGSISATVNEINKKEEL